MAVAEIKLYEQLKPKLGEAETQALLEYVQVAHEAAETRLLGQLVTKADAKATEQSIRSEIQELRTEAKHTEQNLRNEIQMVREELKADIAAVDQKLSLEIQKLRGEMIDMKGELIRTFLLGILTLLGLLSGIMFGLLKLMLP